LDEGRTVASFSHKVRTPEGKEETAQILRIGQIGWAYRIGNRVALATKAPGSEEGFRWKEDLPNELRNRIVTAMEAGGGRHPFPLDVTQSLAIESRTRRETVADTMVAGGPVMIPLGIVALLALVLILERLLFLGRQGRVTETTAKSILQLAKSGEFEEAGKVCASRRGPVARALGACLQRREQGVQAMEDAIQESILHELPRLERFLSAIGILAAVAPLLGLLGTVTGMILTFEMIASYGSGDPRMMAGGISQALITTATGLIIAIPVLLMHSFLAGRVDRLIADTERFAATLLNLLRKGK
jgi:biopolymer transport protein ExbB